MNPSKLQLPLRARCVLSPACGFLFLGLALACGAAAQAQEPARPSQSVADAARTAREQKTTTAQPAKVFTNDDLAPLPAAPADSSAPPEPTPKPVEASAQAEQGCDSTIDERIKGELQAAQDELDQLHRDLAYDPTVISGGNVDMRNFKQGSSGLAFNSPPLSQSQPQSPARIQEVIVQERIASLKQAARIACDSPENAGIQRKVDDAEKQLKLLQQEYDLDQNAYYSKTDYASDTAGKAKLDAEKDQIQSLQAEIDNLKQQLTPPANTTP